MSCTHCPNFDFAEVDMISMCRTHEKLDFLISDQRFQINENNRTQTV